MGWNFDEALRDLAILEYAGLKKILDAPEKRRKLIVYINPPYAEVSNLGATETRGRKAGILIEGRSFLEIARFEAEERYRFEKTPAPPY